MKKQKLISMFLIILVAICFCSIAAYGKEQEANDKQEIDYLVLVNKQNKLPNDWEEKVELKETKDVRGDKIFVEKQALSAFQKLRSDLLKEGIDIELDSTYRSVAGQIEIWDEFTEKYGDDYVKKYVAVPGYSEHHTGLAIDVCLIKDGVIIDENDDMIAEREIFARVHEKLAKYGFILRYLEGKDGITGYSYEPWHFRYVGNVDIAKEIFEKGLTLEEYLENNLISCEDSPEWVAKLAESKNAKQIFVVAGVGKTTAYISMHEKNSAGVWKEIISTPGYIGKFGLGKKREGDGLTPVGTFEFNKAFGIADDPGCSMEYTKVSEDVYWSGDGNCMYNKWVSVKDYPNLDTENSEHLIDYNSEYQYCLNISYNDECIPGKGSAIFLHCFGKLKPYTGGCVSIPKEQMKKVMQYVDKDCVVVIDSLENLSPETWDKLGL